MSLSKICLALALALLLPAIAHAQAHGSSPHPQAAAGAIHGQRDFDKNAALKASQAAVGRTLGDYAFVDRHGNPLSLAGFRGKPLVIGMIYTSCFHFCPTLTKNLDRAVRIARSAVGDDAFAVATIGFDTLHDTPERMAGFARAQGVSNEPNWAFLSSDKATIERLAADIGFDYFPSAAGFDHLMLVTVVDGSGKIYRQLYGMDVDAGLLTETMKELVFGLVPRSLDLSSLINRARLYCTVYDPATDSYRFNYAMVFAMGFGLIFLTGFGYIVVRLWRNNPSRSRLIS